MMDLNGRPVLARVLERARAIRGLHGLMVATTTKPSDQPIADLAASEGVRVFRGNEADVLDRYYRAACQHGVDVIVRLTADCPLLDPDVSSSVLEHFRASNCDFVSNVHPRTYPDGLDTEVFTFDALRRAWHGAQLPNEREHVTPYMWMHPDQFRLANVANVVDHSALRWTLDELEDLEFIRAVYARLDKPGHQFRMHDILNVMVAGNT